MTKRQLAAHIHHTHPEQLYPDTVDGLMTWTFDELRTLHVELHQAKEVAS